MRLIGLGRHVALALCTLALAVSTLLFLACADDNPGPAEVPLRTTSAPTVTPGTTPPQGSMDLPELSGSPSQGPPDDSGWPEPSSLQMQTRSTGARPTSAGPFPLGPTTTPPLTRTELSSNPTVPMPPS